MKATLAFTLAMAFSLLWPGEGHATNLSRETSPGGQPYVLIQLPDKDRVAIQVAWPTDWPAREGANQAVPLLGTRLIMTGGAAGLPPNEIVETMSDIGMNADLISGSQTVKGNFDVKRENLDQAISIVNAHLRAPSLPQRWFERARDELATGAAERRTQPYSAAAHALRWALYGDAPLRRFIIDEEPERIRLAKLADVVHWQASVFTRRPAWIAVAGPLDAAAAGKAVDQMLADLPEAKPMAPLTLEADTRPRRILLHMPEAKTSSIFLIGALPPIRQGWAVEDGLVLEAMYRDFIAAVRTEQRATYDVFWSQRYDSDHISFFVFSADMEAGQIARAEEALRKRYVLFRAAKGTDDLESVKPLTLQAMRDRIKEPADAVAEAIYLLETGQDLTALADPEKVLAPVTFAGILKRMNAVFPQPDALTIIAVSPERNALPGACVIMRPDQAADCN